MNYNFQSSEPQAEANSLLAGTQQEKIIRKQTSPQIFSPSQCNLPCSKRSPQRRYPGKIRGTISLQPSQDRKFEPSNGKVYQPNIIPATELKRKRSNRSLIIYLPPRSNSTASYKNKRIKCENPGEIQNQNNSNMLQQNGLSSKIYQTDQANKFMKNVTARSDLCKIDLDFKALVRKVTNTSYSCISSPLTQVTVKYLPGFDQNSKSEKQQSAVKPSKLRKNCCFQGYCDVYIKQCEQKQQSVRSAKVTQSIEQPSVTNATSKDKGQDQHQANSIGNADCTQRKLKCQTKLNDCKIQTPSLERTPKILPVLNTNGPSGADDMTPFLTQKTLKPLNPPPIPELEQEVSTKNMNDTNGQQCVEKTKDQKAQGMRSSPPTKKQLVDIPLCTAPIYPETTQSTALINAIDGGQPRPTRKRVRKMRKKKSVQQLIKMSPFCETSPKETMHKPSQMLSEYTSTSKQGFAAVKGDSISTRQTGKDNNSGKGLKFVDLEELRSGIVQCRDRASTSGIIDEQQHIAAVAAIADDLNNNNNNNIDYTDPRGFGLHFGGALDATVPEIGKRTKRKRKRGRPQQQNRNSNVIGGNVYGLVGDSQHGLCKATLRESTHPMGLRDVSSDDETLVEEQISLYDQMFAADKSSSVKSLGLICRRRGYLVHNTYLYAQPKGNNSDLDVANANRQ